MSRNSRNFVNRGEEYYKPNGKIHVKDEAMTPNADFEKIGDHNRLDFDYGEGFESCGVMRKSMSMNDIAFLRENIKTEHERNDSYYRQRHQSPAGSYQEQYSKTKFVSIAEAIYHFQRDTPNRYHTTRNTFRSSRAIDRLPLTRPQSPTLRCKARIRTQHIMSQKEKEEMELEEMRKYKIKPQPIPKSVIEGTIHLPEVPRKPITVPEPFNLTEMQKKILESPDQAPNFKARPAPKHILEKPFVPVKPPPQITLPVSPKFHSKPTKCNNQLKNEKPNKPAAKSDKPCIRTGPVRPEPFSFEKRDEELKRRKEERIRRQIEEDKKQATLFRAQPLPGAVKKHMNNVASKPCSSSASSENKENHTKFEAKPATVLYKEPFKPVLQVQYVKPEPFHLASEKRAAEREKFDKQLKEKEEEQERIRQQQEKEQRDLEEKQKAELRAKLIHHPKPMPSAAPFVPEKSEMPLTVPETPKFVRRLKQH